MNLNKNEMFVRVLISHIILFDSVQFKNRSFKFLQTDLLLHLTSLMQFLSDYQPLSQTRTAVEVDEERSLIFNSLNVTQLQAVKVKRLLSARLNNSNLTFMESFENPESDDDFMEREPELHQNMAFKKKINIQNYLNFSLISKCKLPDYEILINFSINVQRFTISFESKILKNYKLVKIESRNLVKYLAKYFLSYNGKIKQGSFFVNPITSEISLFIHNHSSFGSISNLIRNPQKFLVFIMFYVDQTTTKWNDCLESVLYLMNKKSLDEITLTKKSKFVKEKLKKWGQMIIHSHVDADFFWQNPLIFRFQKISEADRNHKVASLKNEYSFMQKRSKALEVIRPILKIYMGQKRVVNNQFKFIKWQASQMKEMSENLSCNEYRGGKSKIYCQIQILEIFHEACIFESGFSKIFQLEAEFKREDENAVRALLIKKKTQQKRYKNEVSVLKLIREEKFLFLPRYYFCQQEEHKQSIFIEFIPEASLDRYLMTKSMFIGMETKLFFLFMVVVALRFLRDNSIVHVDLKPENILIKIVGDGKQSVHYLVKLIDFGQSYSPKIDSFSNNSTKGFTIPYAPPELLSKGTKFDEKTDVYSLGVIMFKIIFNHFPSEIIKLTKDDFIQENYLKFYTIPYEKLQTYGTTDFMSLLYYLCLKCLQPNPNERPTLEWLCIILKDLILTFDEIAK